MKLESEWRPRRFTWKAGYEVKKDNRRKKRSNKGKKSLRREVSGLKSFSRAGKKRKEWRKGRENQRRRDRDERRRKISWKKTRGEREKDSRRSEEMTTTVMERWKLGKKSRENEERSSSELPCNMMCLELQRRRTFISFEEAIRRNKKTKTMDSPHSLERTTTLVGVRVYIHLKFPFKKHGSLDELAINRS